MCENDRIKLYKETQSSVLNLWRKNQTIDKKLITSQLVLIKSDVSSSTVATKKAALGMLEFLLNLKCDEIQKEILSVFHENNDNEVEECIMNTFKKIILENITSNSDLTQILKPWKLQNINKLISIVDDILLNDLPPEDSKNFFLNNVITTMMSTNLDPELRNILIELSFKLIPVIPVTDLSSKEFELFAKAINTKYIPAISELRDKDYLNWHSMWIFLVRFCDKNIHNSMDLTNRLLRVVEFAFRNSNHQQRLKGYDCWKELIDNASLDMNYICTSKQIKLLITPLKAKFSKQAIVICKRFEVFCYLLEKLQDKAVLCLHEFLEFCFGPLIVPRDASKTAPGKTVPQIWIKSTKVLIELLGHNHGKSADCLSGEDVIKLHQPVVNPANFSSYYKAVIISVGECCLLLKENDLESKRETVVKCLWQTVFTLIKTADDDLRDKYFEIVSEILEAYIKQSDSLYVQDLLILISKMILSFDQAGEVVQPLLKLLFTILLTTPNIPASLVDDLKSALASMFSKTSTIEEKTKLLEDSIYCFATTDTNEERLKDIPKIWLCLCNELVSDLTVETIIGFKYFEEFMMWPARYLHILEEGLKKQVLLYWMKLYKKIGSDSDIRKQKVLRELERSFKENPLLASNITSLLNITSQFETNFSKDFVVKLFEVVGSILLLPNMKMEVEQKLISLVMQYFEASLECYKSDDNDEVVTNVCQCIGHILCIHQGYKMLDGFINFIKTAPEMLRNKFSKHLSDLLLDLYKKETDTKSFIAKEIHKTLLVFKAEEPEKEEQKKAFVKPTGRSARIANLAKNSPPASPSGLRFFGKDLETFTPLKVKGSQLNNASPSRNTKPSNIVACKPSALSSVDDDSASKFVPIDTEVKFEPEKLSEHQKEVLKKRRDDIPALYQDLSQSRSQDIFSLKSNSNSVETVKQAEDNIESLDTNENIQCDEPTNVLEEPEGFKSEDLFTEIPRPVQRIEDIEQLTEEPSSAIPEPEIFKSEDLFGEIVATNVEPMEEVKSVDANATQIPENEIFGMRLNQVEILLEGHEEDEAVEIKRIEKMLDAAQDIFAPEQPLEEENEEDKQKRIQAELSKLKMNIVGADEYLGQRTQRRRKRGRQRKSSPRTPVIEDPTATTEEIKPPKRRRGKRAIEPITADTELEISQEEIPVLAEELPPQEPVITPRKRGRPFRKRRRSPKTPEEVVIQTEMPDDAAVAVVVAPKRRRRSKTPKEETPGEPTATPPKKRGRRPRKSKSPAEDPTASSLGDTTQRNPELDSEDVIESSQEACTPLINTSKRRMRKSLEVFQGFAEKIVTQTPKETHSESTISQSAEDSVQSQDLTTTIVEDAKNPTQDTLTQNTQTQSESGVLSQEKPPVLYYDLPKKPQLTESEQIMCRMDTMSMCGCPKDESPAHQSQEELELRALSPDQYKLSMEDLLGTPSTTSIPSSPVTTETPNRTTELLSSTLDISPINTKSEEIPVTKTLIFQPNLEAEESFVDDDEVFQEYGTTAPENVPEMEETTKEPSMIQERSSKLFSLIDTPAQRGKRRSIAGAGTSPSIGRIKRLMSGFNHKSTSEASENVPEEDILTFTREVPSPLAVPRGSILKRKLSDSPDPEAGLPCPKRKRVNFSDPCLTSKKIFIKDEYQQNLEAKRLFEVEQHPNTLLKLFDDPEKYSESEASMELASALILRKDRPIYPELAECEDDVTIILKKITSPLFATLLMDKLKERNVKTIGDLAKMKESEISRLPFKVPAVANVFNALDNYQKKEPEGSEIPNGLETREDAKDISLLPIKQELQSELLTVIRKIQAECGAVDLREILLQLVDQPTAIALLKSAFQLTAADLLEENAYGNVIQSMSNNIGISKFADLLCTIYKSEHERQAFYTAIMCNTKSSLFNVFRVRGLRSVKEGLEEGLHKKIFKKGDVMEQCILPLIHIQRDIVSRLTIVQLGDIVLNRLQNEDVDNFLQRIIDRHPVRGLQDVVEKLYSNNKRTCEDVSQSLQSRLNALKGRERNRVLIKMFQFISSQLDMKTLMNLHVEFLRKIPDMVLAGCSSSGSGGGLSSSGSPWK